MVILFTVYIVFLKSFFMISSLPEYRETVERSRFFQTIQAWPLDDDLNYDGWLRNFDEGEERKLACIILDFFIHYPSKMVNQMLKGSVSKAGFIFAKYFNDWKHSDFYDRCIYSFIPGESLHPTDSGNLFTRKLRDELGIEEGRIVSYQDITTIPTNSPIIFVDDFVGSGAQVYKAWNQNIIIGGSTLSDFCRSENHCPVYAPLIVNYKGYEVINNYCHGLNLCATHILGPEYNLFEQECICWKNDLSLYSRGVDLILNKSRSLGIPSTDGNDTRDEKGFGKQGLAISFEHGAPDAIPSFFYWNSNNWTPLIRKHYER